MTIPAHEIPDTHVVTSIYQSRPQPAIHEDGFEVEVAILPSGEVHSLLLSDHTDGMLVEMPPEVAAAVAGVIDTRLCFEGGVARLNPRLKVGDAFNGATSHEVSIYRSDENPAMLEAGYDLHVSTDPQGQVHAVTLYDHVSADRVQMPPQVARSIAKALSAYRLFPTAVVN